MPAIRRGRGEGETTQAASRDDAYIYLLVISLAAIVLGVVFLFLDYDSFPGKPSAPSVQPAVRSGGAGGAGQQMPPAGGPQTAPPAGGAPTPPATPPPAPPTKTP